MRNSLAKVGRKIMLKKYSIHNQIKNFIAAYEEML